MPAALEGLRVIDLTQEIAGPYATKLLADYGADVVKIEPPDGDAGRRLGPFRDDVFDLEGSGLFLHINTNKRSVVLDLTEARGRELLFGLIEDADVLVDSLPPRRAVELGLDFAELSARNPRLVHASITGFGQTGPYRDYRIDELTMFALGGMMASTGLPGREPVKLALTVHHFYAAMVSTAAILGAAFGAVRHGRGSRVDLSLFEIMATTQDRALPTHLAYQYLGTLPPRTGGAVRDDLMPAGAVACADGYVQFFALSPRWSDLCQMIERPDLIEDPHFVSPENFSGNPAVKAEFDEILDGWLLAHSKQEVMERAQRIGPIVGAVNTMAETFADPQLASREFFVTVDHPVVGPLRYPGAPIKMTTTPWRAGRAPLLGEHTEEVLAADLGLDATAITALRDAGVLG